MQVSLNANDPFHLVYQGNEGAIVNMDLTNTILVGTDEGDLFPSSPNTFIVGPLNYVAVDGLADYWAIALSGTPAVQFMPGVTVWAPSPVQSASQLVTAGLATASNQVTGNSSLSGINSNTTGVAKDSSLTGINTTLGSPAQDSIRTAIPTNISTTGVPLLTLNTVVAQASTTVASSGQVNLPSAGNFYTISQIGFELVISATYTNTNGTNGFILVTLVWEDSTSGLETDSVSFVTCVSATTTPAIVTRLRGPTRGNRLQVIIANQDSHQLTVAYAILQNSRVYNQDAIQWVPQSASYVINGHTVINNAQVDETTLGIASNSALAASGQDGWLVPPHFGPAYLNVFESGVSAANITVSWQLVPGSVYGTAVTPWLVNDVLGAGNPDKLVYSVNLPGGTTQLNIKNNGTVAAAYSAVITVLP